MMARGGSADVTAADHPLADRFVDRVLLMPDGCWQWTGSLVQKGYGQIRQKGKGLRAHRVAYEMFVGTIPQGMFIHHKCRNRGCVNPAAQNARKTHCDRGHAFDYSYPGRNKRACSTCHRQRVRRSVAA